jgi:hypothetical protein
VFESDYLTLLSKSFERGPFLRLCYLAGRVLRNSDCKKDFEFALKLAYSLIKTGERYLEENDDYDIESATAKLYERLGFILFSDDVYDFIPDSTIQIKYNISEDNKLAKYYFERAVVLDPNLIDSYFALGLYYLRIKNYHKSFAYLIKTDIADFKNDYEYAALFTECGCYFDDELKKTLTFHNSDKKAFLSFERAYYTFKDKPRDKEVIYNMAYAYLEGVWVKRNKRKGLSLLKELDKRLKADGKDITKEGDPDGIIKKYYALD